jgi:cob(I)alamin adenosyltransferase
MGQFIKGRHYSEIEALKRFSDCITVRQYGLGCFIYDNPAPEDLCASEDGLSEARDVVAKGEHTLVILDEANVAASLGLFSAESLLELIALKPQHVELVLTGRDADPAVLEKADLVTEMREIKHYYNNGVLAREGIET